MKRAIFLFLCSVSVFGQVGSYTSYATPPTQPQFGTICNNGSCSNGFSGYLFASFQDMMHTSGGTLVEFWSTDLVNYFYTNPFPVYNKAGIVRDPSIIKFTTGGAPYYLFHTNDGVTNHSWGMSSSSDGVNWANMTTYDCTVGIPANQLCWAPEGYIDPAGSGVGALHVFFASSTSGVCCSGFQIYEIHPTASDFITNASSWSSPALITVTGEANIIDPFMVCKNTSTGAPCTASLGANDRYYLLYNDKSASTGCINWATSTTPTGTFTPVVTDQCFTFGSYVEGPSVYQTVAGSPGTWMMCMDNYQNSYDLGQYNCSLSTNNWTTWSQNKFLNTPIQAKQGTIITYP